MPEPIRNVRLPANFRLLTTARRFQPSTAAAQRPALVTRLWPTDQPIYKRPAAIGGAGVAVALAGLAWWLLRKKPDAK